MSGEKFLLEYLLTITKQNSSKNKRVRYYSKTEDVDPYITQALNKAPSKAGGKGAGRPDLKILLTDKNNPSRHIPVMIEAKGKQGDMIKVNDAGQVDNYKKDGQNNYTNIQKYAVNGAVHYANSILSHSDFYNECVAIGINGYDDNGKFVTEVMVYYLDKEENYSYPIKIGEYSDLSFLFSEHQQAFIKKLDEAKLTEEEIELQKQKLEEDFDGTLKQCNQYMHDVVKVSVTHRVALTCGLIMAGMGVESGKGDFVVSPLKPEDLTGENGDSTNDGRKVLSKVDDFLRSKELPEKERRLVQNELQKSFVLSNLEKPDSAGHSKIALIYKKLYDDVLPILKSPYKMDYMGKLFNVLNEWVDIPDGDKNDVVLTPRYTTMFMARLCRVNMDSYVWDPTSGSGGFEISAMNLMIMDANNRCGSPEALAEKLDSIRMFQLMGIEKRSDIYLLHLLNMLLIDGGFQNAFLADSLEFDGTYQYGKKKGEAFPANVLLLNPPYSAPGKGFIFAERYMSRMYTGYAAILIQENAGSGQGLEYTKNILKNHSLVAVIKQADIFCGKAGVQTAIYLFEVGKPHDVKQMVKFIDMSNDGYTRQNRKKSGQEVNLKDTDHAKERYDEVVDVVLYGKQNLKYYIEGETYFEDTITLEGNDWTFAQHKKIDTTPVLEDFEKTVANYLAWEVSNLLSANDGGDE